MRKSSKDYIHQLKKDLDNTNNFIDYFLVVGLSPDVVVSDFLYETDLKELNNNSMIKPEIISKFPPFDKSSVSVDDNIIKHIFPNGFQIQEIVGSPYVEPFYFSLDNSLLSSQHPRKYVSCLLFYESLESYNKVYSKWKNFDDETLPSYILNEDNMIVRKSDVNAIKNNFSVFTKNISMDNEDKGYNNVNNFDDDLVSKTSLRLSYMSKTNSNSKLRNFYVPKCIAFVSLYPFYIEHSKILKTIYGFTRAGKAKKPLEKIIESLLIEVPIPPRGLYKVEFELINEKYELRQPRMNKLPMLSLELELVFLTFKIEQILDIFRHIVLETKIIFFSSRINFLTPIIEGFLTIIYPLRYSYPFVCILPKEHYFFLESTDPYIVGINAKYDPNFLQNLDMISYTYLIVDIDERKCELKSCSDNCCKVSLTSSPSSRESVELPKHYKSKLIDNLQYYVNEIKYSQKKKEDRETFIKNIRDIFFHFVVNILQTYSKFIDYDYIHQSNDRNNCPSIKKIFLINEFLESITSQDLNFYKEFTNTRIFRDFIYRRVLSSELKDKIETIFFDEHIIEKNNRSLFSKTIPTPFLTSNLYNEKSSYIITRPRKTPNSNDHNFLRKPENLKENLKLGQELIWEDNEEIRIIYHIFPSLNISAFFRASEAKNFIVPKDLSEEIERLNKEIVAKTNLLPVEHFTYEMEHSIYVCWLYMFAMTLHYQDQTEKKYLFGYMLKILEKLKCHEIETYNILFNSLSKYGEEYMVMKLYERMILYDVPVSYIVFTSVLQILKKNEFVSPAPEERESNNESFFKKRSFKMKDEMNHLTNKVTFLVEDICIECQNQVNIEVLCYKFIEIRKEAEWAECPNCNSFFLPKIAAKIEIELSNTMHITEPEEIRKVHSNCFEKFVLYSPLFLKMNYSIALLKEYNVKLDVETFRMRYNALFWNSIWYFQLKDLRYDFFLPYENQVNQTASLNSSLKLERKVSFLSINNPFKIAINYNSDDEKLIKPNRHLTDTISPVFNILSSGSDNYSPVNDVKKLDFTEAERILGNTQTSKFINANLILDVTQDRSNDNGSSEGSRSSLTKRNRSTTQVMKKLELNKKIALLNIIREENESHHYGSDNSRVLTEIHLDILEDDLEPEKKENALSARRPFKSMDKGEN